MIELTFRTAKGPMVIQFETPVATPESVWPWAVIVRINGRPSTIVGADPLNALEHATRFTAGYLTGREGLDSTGRSPWPYAKKQRKRQGRRKKRDDGWPSVSARPPPSRGRA